MISNPNAVSGIALARRTFLLSGTIALLVATASAQSSPVVDSGWNSATSTSLQASGRILNQATFGPTANDVFAVEASGLPGYINQQFAQPAFQIPLANPLPLVYGDCGSMECTTEYAWWNDVLFGQDQLRQRVAYELSKLFVVSVDGVDPRYMPNYLNTLSRDAFTNWATLMKDVALSPAMGTYLNMANSSAPSGTQTANENFAREFMQLFSIGVNALNQDGSLRLDGNGNPIPNYTSAQVQSFALAYTGWTFANADCSAPSVANYYWFELPPGQNCPMVPMTGTHSTGAKTLLRGVTLSGGQSTQQDLTDALANVFDDPSLPPFVSRHLIQGLVKSNPSPAYISRVAGVFTNNGAGIRGDMQSVIRAILLDSEARAEDTPGAQSATSGKMRDPVLWWTSVMRAMSATSAANLPNVGIYEQIFDLWLADLDEEPRNATSVFGYYSPDFRLQGSNLYAPEFENENVHTIVLMAEHLQDALDNSFNVIGPGGREFSLDMSATSFWAQFAQQNGPTTLVNTLDALLMHGTMTQDMQQTIIQSLQGMDPATMARCAVYLIVTSPQYRVML